MIKKVTKVQEVEVCDLCGQEITGRGSSDIESGKRVVLSVANEHSIYVKLCNKDSAYQNREPHQDFWQVMWNDFRCLK